MPLPHPKPQTLDLDRIAAINEIRWRDHRGVGVRRCRFLRESCKATKIKTFWHTRVSTAVKGQYPYFEGQNGGSDLTKEPISIRMVGAGEGRPRFRSQNRPPHCTANWSSRVSTLPQMDVSVCHPCAILPLQPKQSDDKARCSGISLRLIRPGDDRTNHCIRGIGNVR